MNRIFFAALATATTGVHVEEAAQDDVDGHLHLLQLSARRSTEKMGLDKSGDLELDEDLDEVEGLMDDSVGHPIDFTWPIPEKVPFGPDGTWATPYCKDILGCDRYCPDGCNGAAMWYPNPYPNTRIGQTAGYMSPNGWAINERQKHEHFIGCRAGYNMGGPIGYRKGRLLNCFNSENSTKPSFWATRGSDQAQQDEFLSTRGGQESNGLRGYVKMSGWGHEFCPAQCVNDAATFKFGNFNGCGSTIGLQYLWYNGQRTNAVGPNPKCNDERVGKVATCSCLWCGEPTTTTTTTEAPTTTTTTNGNGDSAGDAASAADDPHMQTVQGQKVDLS